MLNPIDYDTAIECTNQNGVWIVDPAPLCYLPVNGLPTTRVELVQTPLPTTNSGYYNQVQNIALGSVKLMVPVYLIVWTCGIVRRLIVARL